MPPSTNFSVEQQNDISTGLLIAAGVSAAADGPLPIGDIVGIVLFGVGELAEKPVLEAVSLIVLFADLFLMGIKNRCPDCKRSLPMYPPIFTEEYCRHCGSKIE